MKKPRAVCLLLAGLLALTVAFILCSRDPGNLPSPSETAKPAARASEQPMGAAPADDILAQASIEAAEPEPEASHPPVAENLVKRTISVEWNDVPEKLAGRQRVRIVEADFKYPRLRLEESVTVDPATKLETVTLLRASIADHLLLGLKPGADPVRAQTAIRDMGYAVRAIEPGSYILAEIPHFDSAGDHARAAADLSTLEEFIDFTEPDYLVFPCLTPNDPAYSQGKMWGLHNPGTSADSTPDADIDAPEGWALRYKAPGIVVAVTDTGIQYNHEDLADNMWVHPTDGSHGYDAYDNDDDPMDISGHGTHCAGTIGARGNNSKGLVGVAWDVKLMAVRFLGPNGGATSDAIRSVNYSRQNGAHVISASWGGGGFSHSLFNAIKACGDAGIPFVAAAGNSSTNNDASPHYPSSYNLGCIVAVASTTKMDALSTFSCYGRTSVDIGAPGSSIWSAYIGSNAQYTYLNGTSMATPHVSGALALAKAQFPGEDMATLIDRLYESVDKIPALNGKCSSGGRLNLAHLLGGSPPDVSNDDFADAHRFEGDYGTWIGSNAGATREPGEDSFAKPGTGNKSLWLAFRTPHSGLVSLDVTTDLLGFEVVVFEGGEKGQLMQVAYSDQLGDFERQIRFKAKPDTEYRVMLDTYLVSNQRWQVNYQLAPPNDFFALATPLAGDFFAVTGYNRAATKEVFENGKPHAGSGQGKSVWWSWTATEDGDFTLNTSGSDFDTVLAIYTGTNTKKLTEVASNDDRSPLDWTSQVTFPAIAGSTYHIAVDSFRENSVGNIVLNGFPSGTLNIIRQPASLSVELGKRAVFDVSVLSGGEVSYQWFFDDMSIPGQTSANLVIDPVRADDFGNYKVEVWNTEDLVTSDVAVLSEKQTAPKLVWSSSNQAVASGMAATLAANFSGSTPITYAWTKNGDPIPDADTHSLVFPSTTVADAGSYRLTATNSEGSATADFTLSVVESPWERWEWRRPGIPNATITDIKVYGNEAFAVAATTLFRSTDGVNWSKSVFPQGFTGNSIVKSGNLFLCTGLNTDNQFRVATSTDNAATWTINTTTGYPTTYQPEKFSLISFGNAIIAWSANGQDFFRSTDGIAWTRLTATNLAGQAVNLMGNGSIATDDTTLILASMSSSSNFRMRYYKSADGITWTEHETQEGGTLGGSRFPQTAAYAMGKFHLIGTYSIYTSTDGANWNYHYAPSNGFTKNSLFATNGETLLAFLSGSQTLGYYSNPDDRKFRNLQPANSHTFTAAATFGSKVLYGTDKGLLALAANEMEVTIPKEKSSTLASIEFTENLFIARTTSSSSHAVADHVSGDGVSWKQSALLDNPGVTITGSAYGRYFGTGSLTTAIYSGHNPFDVRLNPSENVGLAPNVYFIGQLPNGAVLATNPGSPGTALLTRAAGAPAWTQATFPITLYSSSKFTSLGNRWFSGYISSSTELIYTSTTGETWTSTGLTGSNAQFASFGGKSWCVFQSASYPMVIRAAHSTNGTTWTNLATTGFPSGIYDSRFAKRVVAFGSYLLLAGSDKNLYFSQDGTTWLRGFTPGKVVDIATGNGQLVAVLENGGLIQTGSPHPGGSAPLVSIASPQTAGTHLIGSQITIDGTVSDPEDGTAAYDCYMDSQLVASGTGNTFRFTVTTTDPIGHTVTVRARDSQGLRQIDAIRLKVAAAEPENLLANIQGGAVPGNHAVTFDGVFYSAGSRSIHRSLDGKSWEKVPIPSFANAIYGMAAGNGALVIQFDNGAIMTTRDGVNWTHFSPNLTNYWVREPIRFSSGMFIAAYQTQGTTTGSVMTSSDGLRWETGAVSQEGYLAWSANSSDGSIIGAGGYQNGVHRTVDNGYNWIPIAPLSTASLYNSHGIFADGQFVVALTGSPGKILLSADASAWVEHPLPAAVTNAPVLHHLGGLHFLGRSPNFSHISPDAITWQAMSHSINYRKITHARGLFVAEASTGGIVTSRNGITWSPIAGLPSTVSRILSNGESYLVIGTNGSAWTSRDGIAWENSLPGGLTTSNDSRIGLSMAELNGRIVTSGSRILVTSADNGRAWTNTTVNGLPPSTSNTFHKVVSSGAEILAFEGSFSSANTLHRSTDGSAFSTVPGLPAKTWADLAWNGSEWMLIATDGSLFRSTNGGLAWTQLAITGMPRGAAVIWFNSRWVVIGADLTGFNTPYVGFTLGEGDILQNHGNIGFYNSNNPVRTVIAHDRLLIWTRGESTFVTSTGSIWTKANLNAGTGNYDYDIYRTPNGFTAFVGSTVAYYPVSAWSTGTTGLTWSSIPSPFNSIQYADNLGDRVFLFTSGTIAELHDKDLALTLPSLAPATLGVGDQVAANVTIRNFGRAIPPGGSWKVTAWLAKNRFYGDTKNIPLGTFEITDPMPAPGASQSFPVSFILPNEILTGDNYLILSLSGPDEIRETNTANNTVISDTAAITIPEWEFSVATNGNGQVNRDFAARRYPHKSQVSLTASAGKGATFTGWAGDAYSPNNQITILMDGDKSVEANFSNRTTLQVFVSGLGLVNGLADLGSYPVGDNAQITAEPTEGWVFSHWSGASSDSSPATNIVMDTPKAVTAHFILPMATWKNARFTPEQLADTAISGNDKDPDHDGVANWKEYIHGSHPMDAASTGVSPITVEGGFLRCIYTRNLGTEGNALIACQAGRGLADWDAEDLEEHILSTKNGIETVEARIPVSNHRSGFIRFRYDAPQP